MSKLHPTLTPSYPHIFFQCLLLNKDQTTHYQPPFHCCSTMITCMIRNNAHAFKFVTQQSDPNHPITSCKPRNLRLNARFPFQTRKANKAAYHNSFLQNINQESNGRENPFSIIHSFISFQIPQKKLKIVNPSLFVFKFK
ncbi:hypothetical protein BpHYR1_033370 [Brachionus plicatilis]|uniref:Uncharacterized protein n=1 Tax=Brachionus plicatilis TaxID=10195 RepID=A0A3M7SR13_BRAPC|nr:hypothetical protein BpHYR1_033370 [Brachionus plicatilis]